MSLFSLVRKPDLLASVKVRDSEEAGTTSASWSTTNPYSTIDGEGTLGKEFSEEIKEKMRISKRDAKLLACDWTQLSDSPLSIEAKAAWAAYRRDLRDIPQDFAFVEVVKWPTQPE